MQAPQPKHRSSETTNRWSGRRAMTLGRFLCSRTLRSRLEINVVQISIKKETVAYTPLFPVEGFLMSAYRTKERKENSERRKPAGYGREKLIKFRNKKIREYVHQSQRTGSSGSIGVLPTSSFEIGWTDTHGPLRSRSDEFIS